jgi:sulfur relay (sulfurtransferase) complex TusBCD TusD component (DsrE family)
MIRDPNVAHPLRRLANYLKETRMKLLASFLVALALLVGGVTSPAMAGDTDPLFVNLTTDEPHRANMGISFGNNQADRGHPLTIFLNDRGVLIGSRANAEKFAAHQKMLAELLSKGAVVLICPMCMAHYGVKESDLLPGLKVGNPGLLDAALFKGSTKTLTW